MEHFYQTCKAHGLKITPQRMTIYKALKGLKTHPSADIIHKQVCRDFPGISLDTVNRTLLTFSKIGMIDMVEGHGDPRRFDPNLEDHHHFYCLNCNTIFDIYDASRNAISIPKSVERSFKITNKRVCLQGYCRKCQVQAGSASEAADENTIPVLTDNTF